MSVVLLVYELDKDGEERPGAARSVPVAGESEFVRVWSAGAKQLGLVWVPLFQSGLLWDEHCDWDAVMCELDELEDWMRSQPDESFALGRLATLKQELLDLRGDTTRRGWIG